jgi:hypothetical protein
MIARWRKPLVSRELQQLGELDLKTSSWVRTPSEVRKLGGALFCDRRYGKVFLYHNGAESYYAARGFRVALQVLTPLARPLGRKHHAETQRLQSVEVPVHLARNRLTCTTTAAGL